MALSSSSVPPPLPFSLSSLLPVSFPFRDEVAEEEEEEKDYWSEFFPLSFFLEFDASD